MNEKTNAIEQEAALVPVGMGRAIVIAGTLFGVFMVVHQLFNLRLGGIVLIQGRYLYLLGGLFLALFGLYGAPALHTQWLGLACVLTAVPVLAAADALAIGIGHENR